MGADSGGNFRNTIGAKQRHKEYIKNELPKGSPIKIPSNANIKDEQKNGYN